MNSKERIMNLVQQGVITTEEALVLLENERNEQNEPTNTDYYFEEMKSIDDQVNKINADIDFLSSLELIAPLNDKQQQQLEQLEDELKDLQDKKNHWNQHDNDDPQIDNESRDKWKAVADEAINQATDLVQHVGTMIKQTTTHVQSYLKEAQERQKELNKPKYLEQNYQFDASMLERINIENYSGTIEVVQGDDEVVRIGVKAKLFTLEEDLSSFFLNQSVFQVEGNTLIINVTDRSIASDLTVHLPKKHYNEIQIINGNGNVILQHIQSQIGKIKMVHGDVTLRDGHFNQLQVAVTNGSITLQNMKSKQLYADIVNGPIRIDGEYVIAHLEGTNSDLRLYNHSSTIEEMTQRTVNGNIKLSLKEGIPFALHAFTKYGSIDYDGNDLEIIKDESHRTGSVLEGAMRYNEALIPACLIECESKTGTIIMNQAH